MAEAAATTTECCKEGECCEKKACCCEKELAEGDSVYMCVRVQDGKVKCCCGKGAPKCCKKPCCDDESSDSDSECEEKCCRKKCCEKKCCGM